MTLAIETRGLTKHYGDTQAVRGIDLKIRRGSIHGILGPNGAGKSTIIGILGTLIRPTSGSALLDGIDVTRDPLEVRRRIGFAMQEAGVDSLATGREFLILQARLYGIDKTTATRRAGELLRLFSLEEAQDKRIGGYSGGMKRRIDLAAALIHIPPVLFLDEPTEGLDPQSRERLWKVLERLNKKTGTTILLSTHYMEEADRLCDRIAILDQGKIVIEGTPQELKESVGGQLILLEYGATGSKKAELAERALERTREVERLQRTKNDLHVYVHDASRSTPGVLDVLKAAHASPSTLRIREPTLNDVYLKYTGRRYEGGA